MKENVYLFDERNFRQRLKDNPFVKSLAKNARQPDLAQLDLDKKSVGKNDADVNKLLSFRNTSFAHRDPTVLLGSVSQKGEPLTLSGVDTLIDRAVTIVNRYSVLFRVSSYASNILGHKDYAFLLQMVREWLLHKEANI